MKFHEMNLLLLGPPDRNTAAYVTDVWLDSIIIARG
jgi:hypothetical protein